MDRREAAVRHYQRLAADQNDFPTRDIEVWLNEYVAPVLADYVGRPAFREHATFPVVGLIPGAGTPERALVDDVDERMKTCARALRDLTGTKTVDRLLKERFPPTECVIGESVRVEGGNTRVVGRKTGLIDQRAEELGGLEQVLGGNRDDLVRVEDYFEPVQEFVDVGGGEYIQRGEMIVSLNPELLPIGNFVVRCLLRRIEIRLSLIESLWRTCTRVSAEAGSNLTRRYTAVVESRDALRESVSRLQQSLRTSEDAHLRDACVVCTQVYAAFDPEPDLAWLGLPEIVVTRGTDILRHRLLKQRESRQALDLLAASLRELRRLYEDGRPDLSKLDEAIGSGGLVIDGATGSVYWEREQLEIDEGDASRLLRALARRPGMNVGEEQVYAGPISDSVMSTARNRLKNAIPASLNELIVKGSEKRTYKLNLRSSHVHLFPAAESKNTTSSR